MVLPQMKSDLRRKNLGFVYQEYTDNPENL